MRGGEGGYIPVPGTDNIIPVPVGRGAAAEDAMTSFSYHTKQHAQKETSFFFPACVLFIIVHSFFISRSFLLLACMDIIDIMRCRVTMEL